LAFDSKFLKGNVQVNIPQDKTTKFIDISPLINEDYAVFPGDTAFKRTVALDFTKGDNLVLSDMQTSMHIGAHVDAPNHYHPDGMGIDKRDLSLYFGPVQVITVNIPRGETIKPKDITTEIKAPRVLFKTGSFPDLTIFNMDFNGIHFETIQFLAKNGVRLVGIDTPSVDPADSKELPCHNEIYKNDMAILEGIVLDQVKDGLYTLCALPLKIEGADASPVRAVLIQGDL
tara:strand:+ start:6092 stop:6781 length:690 start_codon:yes stop_codon:yes gene_type:complete